MGYYSVEFSLVALIFYKCCFSQIVIGIFNLAFIPGVFLGGKDLRKPKEKGIGLSVQCSVFSSLRDDH